MPRYIVIAFVLCLTSHVARGQETTQPAQPTTLPATQPAAAVAALPAAAIERADPAVPAAVPPAAPADAMAKREPRSPARVLIISIDGLRPDLLLRAKTPYIHELFEGGSYSFWARTVPHAITLPSHVSMLTGVPPRKHGIEWNADLPLAKPVYPKVPTLFAAAKKAGYTTALVAGKMKFNAMAVPGTLDWQSIPETEKAEDADVAARATQIIASHRPHVMAVHLPTVDNVGHAVGWATPQQVAAIEQADGHVGAILAALRAARLRESTTVILTADHGGAGRTHMADDVRARHIPWIINGPGVRKGLDLTTIESLTINTEDTFATACELLNIPVRPGLEGKAITAAFEHPVELMTSLRGD